MPDLGCWGGEISPRTLYPHVKCAHLKCSCGLRGWHTKNIGYIGARTIHLFKGGCEVMQGMNTAYPDECHCSIRELSIDTDLMAHVEG